MIISGTSTANTYLTSFGENSDNYFSKTVLLINGDGTSNTSNNTLFGNSLISVPSGIQDYAYYFNGSSWLAGNYFSGNDLGGGDWTVESWLYIDKDSAADGSGNKHAAIASNDFYYSMYALFYIVGNSTKTGIGIAATGPATITATFDVPQKTWFHCAIVKYNGYITIYYNGVAKNTPQADANSWSYYSAWNVAAYRGSYALNGYMSNLRVVRSAVYTSNFSVPTSNLTAITNTLLLTCRSSTITDVSGRDTYGVGGTVSVVTPQEISKFTPVGNPTQGSIGPYGGSWSNYFNGSSYLSLTSTSDLQLSNTTAFTIECWVYADSSTIKSLGGFILRAYNMSSPYAGYGLGFGADGTNSQIQFWDGTAWTSFGTVSANMWTHIVVTYEGSGTTRRFFINGVQQGSAGTVPSTINWTGTDFNIGTRDTSYYYTGYISNLRVIKGTALYTSNFVPPIRPLTAVSGTSLLTCQTNRFKDNSTNNFTISAVGTPTVERFNPFFFSYQINNQNGMSTLFGGQSSNDSIRMSNAGSFTNNVFDINGTVTAEMWVYQTASSNNTGCIMGVGGGYGDWNTANGHEWLLYANNNGNFVFQWNNNNTANQLTTTGITLNQWNHIALGANNGNTSIWLNGSRILNSNIAVTLPTTKNVFSIGDSPVGNNAFTGYISDFRIARSDVYGVNNTTITIPTLPLSGSVTNAYVIFNGSNTGVIDYTNKNNIYCTGNAVISTVRSKYGTGSAYFDGSRSYLLMKTGGPLLNLPGDFTIEMWIYGAAQISKTIVYNTNFTIQTDTSGNLVIWDGTNRSIGTHDANTWTHIAITRSGSTMYAFKNGVLGTTWTNSSTTAFTMLNSCIGGRSDLVGYDWTGYVDDFRVTKDYARYTSAFTVPDKMATFSGPAPTVVQYLVVAGGGGGGYTNTSFHGGAGGGAGGFRTGVLEVQAGTQYTVTIGSGGAGSSTTARGSNGTNSLFGTIWSTGGGGGAWGEAFQNIQGGAGGSGGGGVRAGGPSQGNLGGYIPSEGSAGGAGSAYKAGAVGDWGAAGGGGAATVGQDGMPDNIYISGMGGNGVMSMISSNPTYYAGGGGGGGSSYNVPTPGAGGLGGGGSGGSNSGGTNGTTNRGGGGGGGYSYNGGGNGGSGIVIVAYPTIYTPASNTTGSPTYTIGNGNHIYTFTGSGTITF